MQMIIASNDSEALLSLHEELMDDVDVARSSTVRLLSTPIPGDMGAVEIINLVLSTSVGLASFAVAFSTWRRTRPERPIVTITVKNVQITLTGASSEEARQIVDTFSAMLEDNDE